MQASPQELADEFTRMTASLRQHQTVPLSTQIAWNTEELAYVKEKILGHVGHESKEERDLLTKKLISLRARQAALRIQREKQTKGTINTVFLQKELELYYTECARLLDALPLESVHAR